MPQHVRGDNLGPVRQVHLGGALRPRAGSHVRTRGIAGGQVMALNYITLVLDLADGPAPRSPPARRCSTRRRGSPTPPTT
jgi:hypothetical protein